MTNEKRQRKPLSPEQKETIKKIVKTVWKKEPPPIFKTAVDSHKRRFTLHKEREVFDLYNIVSLSSFKKPELKYKMQKFLLGVMVNNHIEFPPEYGGSPRKLLKEFNQQEKGQLRLI